MKESRDELEEAIVSQRPVFFEEAPIQYTQP